MIKLQTNTLMPSLDKKVKELEDLPRIAHEEFKRATPIDTGRARRSTRLRGTTIEANYPYAQPLEKGWSRQAPRGMVEPMKRSVKQIFDRIFKRK